MRNPSSSYAAFNLSEKNNTPNVSKECNISRAGIVSETFTVEISTTYHCKPDTSANSKQPLFLKLLVGG